MNAFQLSAVCGCDLAEADQWLPDIESAMSRFYIDQPHRQAAFLATIAHESANLRRLEENLNYSAAGLVATWPSRFRTIASASLFANSPARIANFVYASRMGNGDVNSGDGWRFRGRGLLMITGRDMYRQVATLTSLPLLTTPDLLLEHGPAALSAGALWQIKRCNQIIDTGDFAQVCTVINGGSVGFDERMALYQQALSNLA